MHLIPSVLKWLLASLIVVVVIGTLVLLRIGDSGVGGVPSGKRLERIKRSPNYDGNEFVNLEPTRTIAEGGYWSVLKGYLRGDDNRKPPGPLPTMPVNLAPFTGDSSLCVSWFGHSTMLVRIDGVTLLFDPVFDDRVSLQIGGTQRFQPSPLSRDSLPPVDAVVISHDHYDHLEKTTVQYLAPKGTVFVVPLGVGAHLSEWGVADSQIMELDWWESTRMGSLELTCTPARHLSGRTLRRPNKTLWSSWAVHGPNHRIYFGGDTGPTKSFEEISRRYGPFDLTILPIGGYGDQWPDIHLTPEQAVTAHIALRGERLLPVHWGAFDVALHPWNEPIERLVSSARANHVEFITPQIGDVVDVDTNKPHSQWWDDL